MTSLARAVVLMIVCYSVVLCGASERHMNGLQYRIGVARADITGPVAEVALMGYADPKVVAEGLHTRLYSRAFIICENGANSACVVFVNIDAGMAAEIVKLKVVEKLATIFGKLYTMQNVMISAIHTHSGPAGYLQYFLFQMGHFGWLQETFQAQVDGIVKSIVLAHNDLNPSHLLWSRGRVNHVSINRSPTAYLMNPAAERARYSSNVDKDMFLLKIVDKNGYSKGMINWFAVHPTSMNKTNRLVSSDNKGFAEMMFENAMSGGELPGMGKFVAAFASSNLGDVSPNIRGPICIDTGLPCHPDRSTCGGRVQNCIGQGPGADIMDSTRIIGQRMYYAAKKIFNNATQPITGGISYVHQYIDMANQFILTRKGEIVRTCPAAMGYSFAAGCTDGPGQFDFYQTDTTGSPFWDRIRDWIVAPSEQMKKCHHPKPILIASAQKSWPYEWQPSAVPVQLLRVGQLLIAAVPAEFTTMAGRRLRETIARTFKHSGFGNVHVVVAGLSNSYTDYVTTFEEYQKQRYEGASTAYGPYTLDAYLNKFAQLSKDLLSGNRVYDETSSTDLLSKQITIQMPVGFDTHPSGQRFGFVLRQPSATATPGQTVSAVFVAGHPRNNPMLDSTYLRILRRDKRADEWHVVATDASWETVFTWKRTNKLLRRSVATVTWHIPDGTSPGDYKIQHMGYYKTLFKYKNSAGEKTNKFFYIGETNTFKVIPKIDIISLFSSAAFVNHK